jgi:hypothetical protein
VNVCLHAVKSPVFPVLAAFALAGVFPTPAFSSQAQDGPRQEASVEHAIMEMGVALVDVMGASPQLQRELETRRSGARPVLSVPSGSIRNRTMRMIPMDAFVDGIRSRLVTTELFRVLDSPSEARLRRESEYAWAINPGAQFSEPARLSPEEYGVCGSIDELSDAAGRHYRLNLQILDRGSGQVVWSGQDEIVLGMPTK